MIDHSISRPEIVEKYVELGQKEFPPQKDPRFPFKKEDITKWLFVNAQEAKEEISYLEISNIVDRIFSHVTQVIHSNHTLNVGDLKREIANLPDNMPVAYQRIEDMYFEKYNWTSIPLVWETRSANNELIEWVKKNPSASHRIVEKDNEFFMEHMSFYIIAFDAYVHADDEGKQVFVINAHY